MHDLIRNLTYFVSDVHLGLRVGDPAEREARFVSFLRSIPVDRTEALYMLGDIWDFWYEYRDVVPKGYVQVFAALQDLMSGGVKVYFFRGNHDVWTYSYFEEMGMKALEQPYRVKIGEKLFCIGHGDCLGPVGLGVRLLTWVFHNRVLQFLFSLLHPRIAFSFGNGWSRKNRLSHKEYVFRGEEEPICRFVDSYHSETPADCYVFGHYHSAQDMHLHSGARLILLGDWMSCRESYLKYDSEMNCLYSAGMDTLGMSCQKMEK